MAGNRAYFANIALLESKVTKMMLFKTLLRPVVCYGSEALALSNCWHLLGHCQKQMPTGLRYLKKKVEYGKYEVRAKTCRFQKMKIL